jgi:hypothetical protein
MKGFIVGFSGSAELDRSTISPFLLPAKRQISDGSALKEVLSEIGETENLVSTTGVRPRRRIACKLFK